MDQGQCFIYTDKAGKQYEMIKTREERGRSIGYAIPIQKSLYNTGILTRTFLDSEIKEKDKILNLHYLTLTELTEMLLELGRVKVIGFGKKKLEGTASDVEITSYLLLKVNNKILFINAPSIYQQFKAYSAFNIGYLYVSYIPQEYIETDTFMHNMISYKKLNLDVLPLRVKKETILRAKEVKGIDIKSPVIGLDFGDIILYECTEKDDIEQFGNGFVMYSSTEPF